MPKSPKSSRRATHGVCRPSLAIVTRRVTSSTDIPAHIAVDVTELGIGDAIRIAELPAVPGVTIVDNPEKVVVHVTHPTREEEPVAAAAEGAAEPTEPEVLKKGKAASEEEAPEGEKKEKDKEK